MSDNSIFCIFPYKHKEQWVFDDITVGLVREPFVSGADLIIEKMVDSLEDPEKGFTLLFSSNAFPGYQLELEWVEKELGGNWYESKVLNMGGWLCPAMLKCFSDAPERIYA
jgi:hypothetical protein